MLPHYAPASSFHLSSPACCSRSRCLMKFHVFHLGSHIRQITWCRYMKIFQYKFCFFVDLSGSLRHIRSLGCSILNVGICDRRTDGIRVRILMSDDKALLSFLTNNPLTVIPDICQISLLAFTGICLVYNFLLFILAYLKKSANRSLSFCTIPHTFILYVPDLCRKPSIFCCQIS